jgi:hypothetical protein
VKGGKRQVKSKYSALLRVFSVALTCHLALGTFHVHSASWEDEKDEWEKMSSTRFYKDPGYAAKLALNWLPVDNGHFYVGEVAKGIWFSVGQTASLVAVVSAYLGAQSRSKDKKQPIWTDGMIAAAGAGFAGYLGLKVWSAFDAAEGARRYNAAREAERAKEQQGFRWQLRPDGVFMTRRWTTGSHE